MADRDIEQAGDVAIPQTIQPAGIESTIKIMGEEN